MQSCNLPWAASARLHPYYLLFIGNCGVSSNVKACAITLSSVSASTISVIPLPARFNKFHVLDFWLGLTIFLILKVNKNSRFLPGLRGMSAVVFDCCWRCFDHGYMTKS